MPFPSVEVCRLLISHVTWSYWLSATHSQSVLSYGGFWIGFIHLLIRSRTKRRLSCLDASKRGTYLLWIHFNYAICDLTHLGIAPCKPLGKPQGREPESQRAKCYVAYRQIYGEKNPVSAQGRYQILQMQQPSVRYHPSLKIAFRELPRQPPSIRASISIPFGASPSY